MELVVSWVNDNHLASCAVVCQRKEGAMMGKDFIQAVLKAGKVLGMAGKAATGILSNVPRE